MNDVQSIAGVNPDGILALGLDDPEILLRWVYQSLGHPNKELDREWVVALHRGAMNSKGRMIDPEFSLCLQLKRYPVSMSEFLFGKEYLNKDPKDIYPEVLIELEKINNPRGLRVVNDYTEAIFTGGIGSAKSTSALYCNAYQLYILSCFADPHSTFGLDPASEIMFVFLGMSGESADTDYDRFRATLQASKYFTQDFAFDPRKTKELIFPNRIQVVAGINTIGKNIVGGLMDEVNFGQIVKQSKRSLEGGEYNQTLTIYNGLARRRKTRFMSAGKMPGILCLVSSKRYPGEFTDVKIEEAKSDPSIYIYDKRVWDVKPKGTFSDKMFKVFCGSAGQQPEIILDPKKYKTTDAPRIIDVPQDFLKDFQDDIIGSLRDIAGVGTLARYPFFQNVNAVSACFGVRDSILNLEETDLITSQLQFFPERFKDKDKPRWVHIDLGLVSDSLGIACGYVSKFVVTKDEVGMMPQIEFDFLLRIRPPNGGEIQFHKMRKLITLIRDHGLPIKWISFDAFQSVDSIQILRNAGFSTGKQSMDVGPWPYSITKTAMYSGRIKAPKHTWAQHEFISLEKDAKTGKVDHPPNGSKDVSDGMAGVCFGLTLRRELWSEANVRFNHQYTSANEVKVEGAKE